jgi:hypothetical protein
MNRKLLGAVGVVLFGSFASLSGVASANQDSPVDVPMEEAGAACLSTPDDQELEPLVSNPAEYQTCINACKGGSAAMFRYCAVFLDPRVKALCIIASGGSLVAGYGFCYARFMD